MQPFTNSRFHKQPRRAFQDGGAPGSLLLGNNVQDPNAGKYGHAAVGSDVDQGGAMDRSILANNATAAAEAAKTAAKPPEPKMSLRPGAQAALNSYQPLAMPTIGFASGGEILKGIGRSMGFFKTDAEVMAERRANMEKREAEKKPEPKAAEQKSETPAPMGRQSVLDRRMAEAGLKNGGKIKGPGTPTSDSIPARVRETGENIMVSTGERIVSAAQDALLQKIAKARGFDSVDHMFEVETGKPVGPTIKGGMLKAATGLPPIDDLAQRVNKIPAGGTAPAPDGYDSGNELSRNVNNSLNALGGMGVVASVPLKTAQSGQRILRSAMNAAPVLQNGIPRLAAPAIQAAPDFIAGASGVAKAGGANLPAVISNTQIPIAKTVNVALQEGAKANQMAAGTRSLGNASAGMGMLDGQQQRPVEQLPNQGAPAKSPIVTGVIDAGVGKSSLTGYQQRQGQLAPDQNAYHGDMTTMLAGNGKLPQDLSALREGSIYKTVGKNGSPIYSGVNVTGDAPMVNGTGSAIRGGGTLSVMPGMSQAQIDRTLTNPDGSPWSAGDNAIMAANLRDGVDPYRGTSRQAKPDPMDQPMTKDQRASRLRLAEIAMQDKRYGEANAIQQEQLGISRAEHAAKMVTQKQLSDAQAEYLAAGDDPVKLKEAERKLIVLGGKQPAPVRAFQVAGGQAFDKNGVPYTVASSVYDPDTKQFIQQGPQGMPGNQPLQNHISALKKDPRLAAQFDLKYGAGSAAKYLEAK